ncbi:MAG: ribosome maturation factor RimM [Lachnospiraceae bacterium]|nr:ribosome maturation factor RimM [Lachnospiraceae bacterium]
MQDIFRVGVISNTHGIRGEVKVFPTTDDPKRFKKLKKAIIDFPKGKVDVNVESCKFFKNMVILKFKEFDNINDIEKFKGCDLLVTRENAVKLEEGEYFIADILGANVYLEDGSEFGILEDVMQTGANDVYVVKTTDGKEVLIPVIPQCIIERNIEEKKVVVHLLKGLMD